MIGLSQKIVTKEITFFCPGNPRPKQSFRYSKKGSYQTAAVKAWETAVGYKALEAMKLKGYDLFEGRVEVDYRFLRQNRRRADWNNLAKAIDDAMNGVVYKDDSQIKSARVTLGYHKEGAGVWVEVKEMDDESKST